MKTVALVILALLLGFEGFALAVWPAKVKAILGGSHNIILRVIGVLELALIVLILWLLLRG